MRGNVHVRFGGRMRRNGVWETGPPRSAPTLLKQLPKRSGEHVFEIIMRRHEVRSTMMTSNRPLEDWGKLIGDVPSATAILDRFLHHAEVINITGKSYRLRSEQRSVTDNDRQTVSRRDETGSDGRGVADIERQAAGERRTAGKQQPQQKPSKGK